MVRKLLGNIKGEKGESSIANIKDFGGVGDGVTDDTQALINMLNSSEFPMYIPNGTFLITQPINITRDNTTIMSKGTLLFNVENETCLEISSNENNIQILIDGDNTGRIGINISGENNIVHDSTVKNIYSNDNSALGINVHSNNNTVENCHVENVESVGNEIFGDDNGASRGIRVTGLNVNNGSTVIKDNTVLNVMGEEGDSIHLISNERGLMEVVVDNNVIEGFSRRGIKIQCDGSVITKNTITNNLVHSSIVRALDIQSVNDTIVDGNIFYVENISVFGVTGVEGNRAKNTIIKNNIVYNKTNISTLYTQYVDVFEYSNNRVIGGGAHIVNRANNVRFSNNFLTDLLIESTEYAMSFYQSSEKVFVYSNTVANSQYHRPLRSSATDVRIVNNIFTDYIGGIELSSTGSGLVVNNVIKASNVISTSPEGYTVENNVLI